MLLAEVGQEASTAGHLPHISVPAQTDAAPQVGVSARVIFVQLPGTSTSWYRRGQSIEMIRVGPTQGKNENRVFNRFRPSSLLPKKPD